MAQWQPASRFRIEALSRGSSTATICARCLLDASALYCPDIERATAGLHFIRVLETLGIRDRVAAKLHPHPNGARAMAAMAEDARSNPGAVGCTQVTEILYTPGVTLVAPLPVPFALTTVYAAAASSSAESADAARRFIAMLTGAATRALRRSGGFD